jgi:hypothetical protein
MRVRERRSVRPGPTRDGRGRAQAGAASVEHVALTALVAALAVAVAIAIGRDPPDRGARELGSAIARRLACAPRHPVPCGRNPLALAYGFGLGKLVRMLAPAPSPVRSRGGAALLPVDFRRCRRPSCAAPSADPGHTASLRRVTAFTELRDRRRSEGGIEVVYWLYRPTLGWDRIVRRGGDSELAAASSLRLDLEDDPALVPLETLPGRHHYAFPPSEEPPWRWRVPATAPPFP